MSVYPRHLAFPYFEATTGWTILGDDTANLIASTNHITGTASLGFDKVDGLDNNAWAGADRTVAYDFSELVTEGTLYNHYGITWTFYCSDKTDIAYTALRLGTDAANYVEWRQDDGGITAGMWTQAYHSVATGYVTGTGCDWSAITYMAFLTMFDAAGDTLALMAVDLAGLQLFGCEHVAVIG